MMIVSRLERAICLMLQGRHGDAMNILDESLIALKTYFLAQEVTIADLESPDQCSVPTPSLEAFAGPVCMTTPVVPIQAMEYPIYQRVMLVRGTDESMKACEVELAIFTAVVLYNKALIFHVLGQGDAEIPSSTIYITKARVLYEKALSLINTCCPSTESNFRLKSALLNNLGQICAYLCDRSGEQACLLDMEQLLGHCSPQCVYGDEETELKLNIMLLLGVHRPSPAA